MARSAPPVFLARTRYRQRRLRDALRLMPVLGAVGFCVPMFWPTGAGATSNAGALIYIFFVWACLIGLGGGMTAFLRRDTDLRGDATEPGIGAGTGTAQFADVQNLGD